MDRILARVFLPRGQNIRINTTPGRYIQTHGGCGVITDHRDMATVLQMPEARILIEPKAMPWAPEWLRAIPQISATLELPEGWQLAFRHQCEWAVRGPDGFLRACLPDQGEISDLAMLMAAKSHKEPVGLDADEPNETPPPVAPDAGGSNEPWLDPKTEIIPPAPRTKAKKG